MDLPEATHHARVVIEVLGEAVGDNALGKIREQLPEDWYPLFAGSQGEIARGAT